MSYAHLSRDDRYVIAHLRIVGWTMREIGRRVGRSASTVSRELKRNGPPADATWPYWYGCAQRRADERWRIARHWYRRDNVRLREYVNGKIRLGWSPEQVVSRLALDHSQDRAMRLGIETLYRWIYADARQGGDLYRHLRRRHQKRRRQRRYGSGRRFISGRVGIEERPDVVDARKRFGDWEGDTVLGARGQSQIATHVERKSRYLMAARLQDRKADTFATRSSALFRTLPAQLKKTLTLDNGSECARFDRIEKATGVSVYFADPYSAWQRGANENTNGLLRDYFPKKTDFAQVTDRQLRKAVGRLNNRPRKCLGYRTPQEVLSEAKRVALAM